MPSRDRLRVVGSEPDAARESEAASAPPARRDRAGWIVAAVLLVVLALGAWRFATEHQQVVRLEGRVEALSGALERAEGEIAARREHLGAVRSSVSQLQHELGALAELVAQEPGEAAAEPPPPAAARPFTEALPGAPVAPEPDPPALD